MEATSCFGVALNYATSTTLCRGHFCAFCSGAFYFCSDCGSREPGPGALRLSNLGQKDNACTGRVQGSLTDYPNKIWSLYMCVDFCSGNWSGSLGHAPYRRCPFCSFREGWPRAARLHHNQNKNENRQNKMRKNTWPPALVKRYSRCACGVVLSRLVFLLFVIIGCDPLSAN